MKKNELIHVHTLLVEIASDYRDRGVLTSADLEPYHQLGIGPMALRDCRADHERAVRTLMTVLAVCAARDLDRDADAVPGRHLLRTDEAADTDADQRVTSH
ncbi:UPF0058 family protein [Haloferax marisrubri]|uniref:Metal-binding protein n=1 Tax=Haloferax marisrubri TaxID=1544719 RepID=A0A2P4NNQ5_9EURY|nr:UPF0058 family protein [Haloferax marisrubri]POG54792.1 hypothetical protein AUR65_013790 [Haloferax marisrubri]